MNHKDYYYILIYSGTLFFFVAIYLFYKDFKKLSYYIFFLFLTTIFNWNNYTRTRFPIIKIIDKIYVSFLLLIIIINLIIKLSISNCYGYDKDINFFDLLITGFIIQILFFYTLSKYCSYIKNAKKSIFHSIMHLNGVCLMLCLSTEYINIC